MTKKNMIQEIQNQEAQAYLSYMQSTQWYGASDTLTDRLRGKWAGIYQLMESLGIASDLSHPDNVAAAEIRESLASA